MRRFLDAQGNGPARRAAQSRLLTGFERSLSPRSLVDGTAHDLQAFLDGSIAEGLHPNTVRKWLVIARSFYAWLYRQGHISAETLLAIREIRPPAGSSTSIQPRPYSRSELSALTATLDQQWPKLTHHRKAASDLLGCGGDLDGPHASSTSFLWHADA